MKKVFVLILTLLLAFGAMAEGDLRVVALKGPTAIGMVKMRSEAEGGDLADRGYSFEFAAAIDEVTPQIVQGNVDIAAVPANLASVLYNNTEGAVQVLAINTLGVLYIVENGDSVQDIGDLRGKTVYASGKGATPEYALNYILTGNGIDPETDVTIEWKSEHAECLNAMLAAENGIALLPQPFVTVAQTKSEGLRVAVDLNEAWDALQEGSDAPSALLTGVVVVRRAYAEEHPEEVSAFLDDYAASVAFTETNLEEAAALVGGYDIVPEPVALKAIPACNITMIEGEEMEQKLSGYLAVLYEQNPKSVGGSLPDGDFYYKR
ncbi:MAG: ABC transporter substrate-binding protein [Clostridia bacterium]|nr:ABC transporter substrate-binding protein [Clostridia bacterium]